MGLLERKDAATRAAERATREQDRAAAVAAWEAETADRRAANDQRKAETAAERQDQAFARSLPGKARVAFERGDPVFQCELDVLNQQAVIVAMVGSSTNRRTTDPLEIVNAVCREGWDLVNGSFVFVEQGQQSRDKFLSSGQNVAIKGTVRGYYLFRRDESAKLAPR